MSQVDEILNYLYGQIDPRDASNPKYAKVWEQIRAVEHTVATINAVVPAFLRRGLQHFGIVVTRGPHGLGS